MRLLLILYVYPRGRRDGNLQDSCALNSVACAASPTGCSTVVRNPSASRQ
jgi:hypothetical protein